MMGISRAGVVAHGVPRMLLSRHDAALFQVDDAVAAAGKIQVMPLPLTYVNPPDGNLSRPPAEQVWAQIEKDLKDATALPSKSQWDPAQDGQATAGATWALLGKAYRFQKNIRKQKRP
jgi:hypothetical protein